MMGRSKNRIPPVAQPQKKKIPTVNAEPAYSGSTNHLPPAFSFLHFDQDSECPSAWASEEIKTLFVRLKVAAGMTWEQVIKSGGAPGNKTGLGFTPVDVKKCSRKLPMQLSDDIDLSEIRVSEKARIFGVRNESTYFVIWLDRNHAIFPG